MVATKEVTAKVTGTYHDGTNMIVLTEGEKATVAETSLSYLRENDLIEGGTDKPQLDHDNDGSAGGSLLNEPVSLTGKNKADLLKIAEDEGVTVEDGATNKEIVAAIEAKRAEPADAEPRAEMGFQTDPTGTGGEAEGEADEEAPAS